jgi:hypothetical protein
MDANVADNGIISSERLKEQRPLGGLGSTWEANIKMDLTETDEAVTMRTALVKKVMNVTVL